MDIYNVYKQKVLDTMNRVYGLALTTTSGGNISMMDENGNIYITPSGVDKGTLTVDDIMVVTADGERIGKHTPSMELPFHSNIYKSRPDVKAVVHAHAPAVVAYATARKTPDATVALFYKKYLPTIAGSIYALPGSLKLGDIIMQQFLKGNDTVMMDNHGATCCGADLVEAFAKYETLDFLCNTLVDASCLCAKTFAANYEVANKPCARADGAVTVDDIIMIKVEELITHIKRSYKNKLVSASFGTMATRINSESFIINRDSADRANLGASDIQYVNKGNVYFVKGGDIKTKCACCDYLPSVEAIFNRMPEVNNIFISMPAAAMSFAITHRQFDSRLIPESYIMLKDVGTLPCGAIIGASEELFGKLSTACPVVIADNEAILTIGKNITKTFDRMEVLDYSARSVVMASHVADINPINSTEVEEIDSNFSGW